MLQTIRHLLIRSECFREERELPGRILTGEKSAPWQGTHNNLCENAIRPFVIGRKNWLFADTPAGAEASARLYSLIETAKANDLEPYAYLRRVFTDLPKATTLQDIEALLPWNVTL